MHKITRWATEFVNLLLAFQQVGKFWSFPAIINIQFFTATDNAWYIFRSSEENEEKSDSINLLFYLILWRYNDFKPLCNYIVERFSRRFNRTKEATEQ